MNQLTTNEVSEKLASFGGAVSELEDGSLSARIVDHVLSEEAAVFLASLENLSSLVLRCDIAINSRAVKWISQCQNLRKLTWLSSDITNGIVGELSSLGSIQELSLAGSSINDSCLIDIGRMSTLVRLNLSLIHI